MRGHAKVSEYHRVFFTVFDEDDAALVCMSAEVQLLLRTDNATRLLPSTVRPSAAEPPVLVVIRIPVVIIVIIVVVVVVVRSKLTTHAHMFTWMYARLFTRS